MYINAVFVLYPERDNICESEFNNTRFKPEVITEYNSSGAKKKSKTSSTNLTNSNRTSAIPRKSDTSGYNVRTAGHSKEKSYTDVPLTSLHADQGRKKPSMDDLSKEEKDSVI